MPPIGNYIKVNVDAGFDERTGSGTTGVVLRNATGNLFRAQALWYEFAADDRSMEALALRDGLRLASELGHTHLMVESDALQDMCNLNTYERANIGGICR